MNKTLNLFLLMACIVTGCRHNNYLNLAESDWKKHKLNGRVKKIVRKSYYNDTATTLSTYNYNEQGFLLRVVDSTLIPGRKWVDVTTYQYDTVGNSMITTRVVNDSIKKVEYYDYDRQGNLVEVRRSMSKTTYSYDNKNRVVKVENYISGALNDTKISEYKQDGSSITVYTDEVRKRKTTEIFKTDSVEIYRSFDVDGNVRSTLLSRKDKAGHVVYAEGRNGDGKLDSYTKRFYNQNNDDTIAITFRVHSNKFDTINTKFTYDKTGNWTEVKGIWTREITYW